jgi:hypothetical protein
MDNTLITETFIPIFPEEIIRNIKSYLIMKISKRDYRYRILKDYFWHYRNYKVQKLFYSDGVFRGYILKFYNPNHILLMCSLPRMFIEYSFQNLETKEKTNDRCWFNNQIWERYHHIGGWTPNPNSYFLSITLI